MLKNCHMDMSRTESEESDEVKSSLALPYLKVRVNGRRQGSSADAHGRLCRCHGGEHWFDGGSESCSSSIQSVGEKASLSQGTHLGEVWSVDQVTRLCEVAWECQ